MTISRRQTTACLLVTALALAGCGSSARDADRAQERAFEAQERVAERRLELVEQYQDCIKKAGADHVKVQACESYLKAAEALK